jgi:hypothetical protein
VGVMAPNDLASERATEPIRADSVQPGAAARHPAVPPTSPEGSQPVTIRPPSLEEYSPPDGRWGIGSCGPWIGGKPPICTEKASS